MDAKRPYGLYVVRPEDIGDAERFYMITPNWCLLYTQNEPPERHEKISLLTMIPKEAAAWLQETIEQVRAEYLTNNQQEILRRAKDFNERFREELEREQKKLIGKEATPADA